MLFYLLGKMENRGSAKTGEGEREGEGGRRRRREMQWVGGRMRGKDG